MNKRDIELLISARDTTGRTFQQVASNIDSLTGTIEKQVAAASRGEISLQELRQSQEKLAQAGRDLSALQGQIDAYRRLEAQLEKNKAAVATAESAFTSFKAEIASSEKVTAAQERRLAGLESKVTTTGAALRKTETDIAGATASLKAAGVETAHLDQVQTQIVNTARNAGAGFSALGGAVDSFSDDLRRAQQAESQLAATSSLDRKIAEARQLGDASKFVRLYSQAVAQVGAEDQRLASLQGFRQVGQLAAEASRDVSRFASSGRDLGTASSEIANGLRAIVQPGTEALRTIDGLEAAITQASLELEKDKQSVGQYSAALNNLQEASAALLRAGGLVDSFKNQETAVAAARNEFARAQAEVQQFATAMANADQPTEKLVRDLNAAEGKLEQTGRALQNEETRLIALTKQLNAAGIESNQLAAASDRLGASATRAAGAIKQGESRLGRNGAKSSGFLGLNPFDLQNLSFQLQDIFVGITSGQKPLTILVQQGTQIAGIFPGLITSVATFALKFFPLIAIVVGFGAAVAGVTSEINTMQNALNTLGNRGIADTFDPQRLIDAQKALEDTGLKAEEAEKAIAKLLDATSDPTTFSAVINAATEMNDKLGIGTPEAVDALIGVMEGGIEAVESLAESTHLLTNEELDHAQALFDAGKAAEARQYILDTVNQKLADQASLTSGVFTPAIDNLKTAFSRLANFLRDVCAPIIDFISEKIKAAIVGFTFLTGLIAGKSFNDSAKQALGAVQPKKAAGGGAPRATAQDVRDRQFKRSLDEDLASTRKLTTAERLRRAEVNARRKAQEAGVSKGVEDLAVTRGIAAEQKKIADEAARGAKKGNAAKNKAAREAAKLERQQESSQKQLEGQLRQLEQATGKVGSATLEERLAVVDSKYEKIFDTLAKMRDLGLTQTSDGESFKTIEARVNAAKDLLKQTETIKFYEDQINLLVAQRKDEINNISDAQERGATSVADAFTAAEGVNKRITPQIVEAAQKALAVAKAIAGVNPSPEIVSLIARLENILQNEPTNAVSSDVAKAGLDNSQAKLNALLAERNDLVEAYNVLNQLSLKTDEETRVLTQQAFAATAGGIREQTDRLRQTVELLHQQRDALTGLPILTDAAYAAWIAKLDAVNAGLVQADSRIVAVNQAAQQAIVAGVTDAFNTAAQSIVGLISGTQSFGDVLGNVFRSALQFAAQFLQAIAQVLIQMIALKIAQAALGGGGGGLGGLFFHSGGVVGIGGSRRVRTAGNDNWIGAPKFHGGGGLGLKPDEYKAILKRGEEVLTEDNPRHISNVGKGGGGGGGQSGSSVKQVLLFDQNEIPRAMQTKAGERAILTTIRANKATLKQMLS